jgi:hypothetical protein
MSHSLQANYYRTALLLGLIAGEEVLRWANTIIEREPTIPDGILDLSSVPATDLSQLRDALCTSCTHKMRVLD